MEAEASDARKLQDELNGTGMSNTVEPEEEQMEAKNSEAILPKDEHIGSRRSEALNQSYDNIESNISKTPNSVRKRVNLSVAQKLEVVTKLEAGVSVAQICREYGIKKQTVSDIKKKKDKLKVFALKYSVGDAQCLKARKHMKSGREETLEEAVYNWYIHQRVCGVNVRAMDLRSAARSISERLNVACRISDGWLWRFRTRHGLRNLAAQEEPSSTAGTQGVEPFRIQLNDSITKEKLDLSQVYNADETGLIWLALPRNTHISQHEDQTLHRKISKERLSLLLCANGDGAHRLKIAVVGKSASPRLLKDCMDDLPVHYFHSPKACLTPDIFTEWFFRHFVPEVRRYQMEVLKKKAEDVQAILILDNAPAYPRAEHLVSEDGKIRVLFLPSSITSLIQPMDQGVIVACKRLYQKRYLQEVLAVLEEDEDMLHDIRPQRTFQNIRSYSIKAAIYNLAAAWRDVKATTLCNSWKKLLIDADPEYDFEGLEAPDFLRMLHEGGETGVSLDDVQNWLDENEADAGYQVPTTEGILDTCPRVKVEEESDEDTDEPIRKPKMARVRECIETLINYIDAADNRDVKPYYEHLRGLRDIVIREQYQNRKQLKMEPCSHPVSPAFIPVETLLSEPDEPL